MGLAKQFVNYTLAYPIAMKQHLRGEKNLQQELTGVLSTSEIAEIEASKNMPFFVAGRLSAMLVLALDKGFIIPPIANSTDQQVFAIVSH